jgi:hypothetical protein
MRKYSNRPGLKKIDVGVRKVATTYGRTAVISHVDKGGGTMVFESNAERLVAHLLGFDPRVKHFQRQPFTVDLVERRLLRSEEERSIARKRYARRPGPSLYTPDFFVECADRRLVTIEVKLKEFTGQQADHERMEQASQVLIHYGHEFWRVHVPNDLAHPLHANTALAHQAHMRKDTQLPASIMEQVEHLAEQGARWCRRCWCAECCRWTS